VKGSVLVSCQAWCPADTLLCTTLGGVVSSVLLGSTVSTYALPFGCTHSKKGILSAQAVGEYWKEAAPCSCSCSCHYGCCYCCRSLANEVCTVDEAKAVYPFMGE
jgi:hypothetical protein